MEKIKSKKYIPRLNGYFVKRVYIISLVKGFISQMPCNLRNRSKPRVAYSRWFSLDMTSMSSLANMKSQHSSVTNQNKLNVLY
jgi:hypothetical protein